MKAFYKTDIGNVRKKNEDSICFVEEKDFVLAAVADGMGGHRSGEIASQLALESAEVFFKSNSEEILKDPKGFINKLFDYSCKKVYRMSTKMETYEGMGTTMTLVVIDRISMKAYFGNIGDSRAYLMMLDDIIQVTEDHTLVNEMYKKGQITMEEFKNHPQRNVLTKALGTCESVFPDYYQIGLNRGTSILLCSDGLSNYLTSNEIKELIMENKEEAVDLLIEEAKNRGGTDNISAILIFN
jgi:protein phosphatase